MKFYPEDQAWELGIISCWDSLGKLVEDFQKNIGEMMETAGNRTSFCAKNERLMRI